MKKKCIEVNYLGLTIKISSTASRNKKNGRVYKSYQLADYSTGERKKLTFSDLEEAKKKARELAEAKATGRHHTLDWDVQTHAQVHRALDMASALDLRLDDICQRFIDTAKVLGGDYNLMLPAAYYFKEHAPQKVLKPMLVKDAVAEFLADRAPALGLRRRKTNASCFAQVIKAFGDRHLHEIESLEIHDWTRSKNYAARTRNDALNLLSQFYRWAIIRNYAVLNPSSSERLERSRVRSGDIGIFTPTEARKLLSAIRDELKPFAALWLFSGLRKEEISRITWEQVDQGLASGSIYLLASQAKTGEARSVPISDNLKHWLLRYRQASGLVLPPRWRGKDAAHQLQRLDDLTGHFTKRLGYWITNAPRHSFASYHLALAKNPAETVRQMGTSLVKLQQHYWSRAQAITTDQAKEWFAIFPEDSSNVIPLPSQEPQALGSSQSLAG